MDSRDIFRFRFVDRYEAKSCLNDFIHNSVQDKVFWLSGCSGTGKTYLLENVLKKCLGEDQKTILYSFGTRADTDELQGFIEQIQSLASIGFLQFLRTNYTSLLDISKQIVSQTLKNAGIDIGGFISAAHDGAKVFVSQESQQHSAAKVIEKYLEVIVERQQLVIAFDHFSSCARQNADLFMQIIGEFSGNPNIRFIICTTDEIIKERPDIQGNLVRQLPTIPLALKPFDEEMYFYEILEDIFSIPENARDTVSRIFTVCRGFPVKLQVALTELYRTNAIQLGEEKATIDFDQVRKFLLREEVKFQPNSYHLPAQILMRIIIAFNECANTALLLQAAEYALKKMAPGLEAWALEFPKQLDLLCQHNVVNIDFAQGGIVRIPNPLVRESIKEFFSEDPSNRMFSGYLVSFLSEGHAHSALIGISDDWTNQMIVLHSVNGRVSGWLQTALEYGRKKYSTGSMNDAYEIFSMIQQESKDILTEDLSMMANCYYAVGNYNAAESLMFLIAQRKDLDDWNFHFNYSRILNVQLKKEQALHEATLAAERAQTSEEQILALNMQQQILVDTTGGKVIAKEIFLSVVGRLKSSPGEEHLILPALKCSVDFFHGTKTFIYMEQAKEIANREDNKLELAYILTNEGFEHFRQGDRDKAEALFIEAANILENIRIHEISYPLNNLANCYMACGDYERAVSVLLRAIRWNHSGYVSFTTQTLLMACYSYAGDTEKSERIANELLSKIQSYNISDTTMLRKIYLNIALMYRRHGKIDLEQEYAEKAYHISAHTSSWFRAYQVALPFLQDIPDPMEHCPKGEEWYWCHGEHEPWLVTFSHD